MTAWANWWSGCAGSRRWIWCRAPGRSWSSGGSWREPRVGASGPIPRFRARPVLVTGGAGFIGANLADRLAQDGQDVLVFDALTRPGVARNLEWLKRRHPRRISAAVADIRDEGAVRDAAMRCSGVFHLAAQVAVTTSMAEPMDDFDINVRGTMHVLEALRRRADRVPLVFASTNKVYGDLHDIALADNGGRLPPHRPGVARRMAWARAGRSTSTRPMAVPRARPTSMCWTTPAASGCPPACCG